MCEKPSPPSASTTTFDSVISEIQEHLFYLMRWLRIVGTNHLIFFDRGANAHLVQGKMAVAAGFMSLLHVLHF